MIQSSYCTVAEDPATMTSHRTYRQLFWDSAEGPIAPDEIIAVNAKIYEQFASVTKSNLGFLSLIH